VDYLASEAPTIRLGDIADHYRNQANAGLPLRCRTLLNLADGRIMRGHTVHVAERQLDVTVPSPLAVAEKCAVFLAIAVAEHTFTIVGTGYILTCAGSYGEGFQVELRFVVEEKKSLMAMEQLFSTRLSTRIQ
jgi:hypothetical protein